VERLKHSGRTIILTTHYMDEAERLCDHVAIMDHGKIIARGTPRELIGSIGADHVVEFGLEGADGAVTPEQLQQLHGVRGVRQEAGRYLLSVSELHRSVPAVLEHVARSGAGLTELRTHSATLEDVFVCMTGRHLRDE
jgi:ABC-2 type transport system ATP-binding protein